VWNGGAGFLKKGGAMAAEVKANYDYATQFEICVHATDRQTSDLCTMLRSQLLAVETASRPSDRGGDCRIRRIKFAMPAMFGIDERELREWLALLQLHDATVSRK
jgi:hypothetical protein